MAFLCEYIETSSGLNSFFSDHAFTFFLSSKSEKDRLGIFKKVVMYMYAILKTENKFCINYLRGDESQTHVPFYFFIHYYNFSAAAFSFSCFLSNLTFKFFKAGSILDNISLMSP